MHYYYSTVYFSWQSLGRLLIMILLEVSEGHPLFLLQLCNRRTQERPLQRPCWGGGGGVHVARLNFEMSRVGVYKCLSLLVGFAVTVAIWPREVVSCRDFILPAVATFWAMSLVGIYLGRASSHD